MQSQDRSHEGQAQDMYVYIAGELVGGILGGERKGRCLCIHYTRRSGLVCIGTGEAYASDVGMDRESETEI